MPGVDPKVTSHTPPPSSRLSLSSLSLFSLCLLSLSLFFLVPLVRYLLLSSSSDLLWSSSADRSWSKLNKSFVNNSECPTVRDPIRDPYVFTFLSGWDTFGCPKASSGYSFVYDNS